MNYTEYSVFFHSAFASIYLLTYLGNRGNLGVLTMLNISSVLTTPLLLGILRFALPSFL